MAENRYIDKQKPSPDMTKFIGEDHKSRKFFESMRESTQEKDDYRKQRNPRSRFTNNSPKNVAPYSGADKYAGQVEKKSDYEQLKKLPPHGTAVQRNISPYSDPTLVKYLEAVMNIKGKILSK